MNELINVLLIIGWYLLIALVTYLILYSIFMVVSVVLALINFIKNKIRKHHGI